MDPTDNDLMLRARDGDSAAFEEIVGRWEGPVSRILARLAGPGTDVEDLLQEAFLNIPLPISSSKADRILAGRASCKR